uniref:Gypsy retrotransposon integrase-like protein 1 n=1 Tax=Oryzias latipes TaxID=8090 RepID=A0A3B3I4L9_ORYLA
MPKGLVGSKCTAILKIAQQNHNCLLDTGSQVTTVSVSFFNQFLHDQQIRPLFDLLQVEGAAGHLVPYLGYVELTITFPKDFLGSEIDMPTLALVVPDAKPHSHTPVLVGMNTLESLYDLGRNSDVFSLPTIPKYRAVLKLLQINHQQNHAGSSGVVKLLSQAPVSVPAGRTVVLEGTAQLNGQLSGQWAVIDHSGSVLPGKLYVQSCLVTVSTQSPNKVPVIVKNESKQDVTIPPFAVIASIGASPTILSHQTRDVSLDEKGRGKLHFNFGDSPIPIDWKERVKNKLTQMSDVFSHHDLDFGCTNQIKHQIHLHDPTPFKHRARPIHPNDIEAVRKHIQDLLKAGVIRESESSFSSPIVVVRKRNGDVRLCIDYRKLNLQTIKDAYALPNLEESFSALTGSKWFTVLDLKSGYYQIEMDEKDRAKTAFVTPLGFWEWNRMPQGVTNAPSTFQRLMEKCMGDLNLREVLVFLDDIIVFSATLEEHEERLLKVLKRLKEFGLKLSPDKCRFFQSSVRYLGHVVSERGVETDPEKVSTLKSWPVPRNLKELRSFLGFAGYYRRFIKSYATIVGPLNHLTRGYEPSRRTDKSKKTASKYTDSKQPFGDRWTPACQTSFETVIDKLTSAPVLAFANPKLPYILHTDASLSGLGAVLYQEQEGQLRVIAYASRGLSQSESHYPAHKLEFLALKWSVTEKFHDYLYGSHFTVITDNNPLTYILTSAKLDATSHRWLAALSTYSFKLQYRSGKQNNDADVLSRRPHPPILNESLQNGEWDPAYCIVERLSHSSRPSELPPEVVDAICQGALLRSCLPPSACIDVALVESMTVSTNVFPEAFEEESSHGLYIVPSMTDIDLQELQYADPAIREVIQQLEAGEKVLPVAHRLLPELSLLLREWSKLKLVNGVLYREKKEEDKPHLQLVLPPDLRPVVLESLHNDMGHMGIERTLDLVRQRFFWPKMAAAVEHYVKTCNRCVRRKSLPEKAAPLVNIHTTRPLELLCMDFLSLEPDSSNTKDILVLTDHFTKFAVAIPTPNQKARTVAKCLWNDFIVHYGIPERLHSDQGSDFESRLVGELCDMTGIKKSRTTPYHPRGNPVERFNRTLLNMLGTLDNEQKVKWKEHVKPLVHAYNCTRNDVTGYTPYELLFGRLPRLPVDLAFGLPIKEPPTVAHTDYVKNLKARLEESYKLASKNAWRSADKNKSSFDKYVKPASLQVGDRVLVRNVKIRGKHKLADRWEHDVYVVVSRAGDLPVYVVQPESGGGPTRTLHRDLLLPCGFLPPCYSDNAPNCTTLRRPHTRSQSRLQSSPDITEDQEQEDDEVIIPTERTVLPMSFSIKHVTDHDQQAEVSTTADVIPSTTSGCVSPPQQTLVVGPAVFSNPPCSDAAQIHNASEDGHGDEEDLDMVLGPQVTEEDDKLPAPVHPLDVAGPSSDDCEQSAQSVSHVRPVPSPVTCSDDADALLRRSSRMRKPPSRFQYSALGNPLVSVVQSLFQSLSDVYTEALALSDDPIIADP